MMHDPAFDVFNWNEKMKILVTGSSGHLGEAACRLLATAGHQPIGLDLKTGPMTTQIGSITDRTALGDCMAGASAVIHCATLHKPHVATHSKQDFIDTNITGTLALLETATHHGVDRVIFTSTTSAFGAVLAPAAGAPAVWIDQADLAIPKNIYGTTKTAAEDLCQLFARHHGLHCVVLRVSRFFPEEDDSAATRNSYADENAKANEFLFRRVDIEDAARALLAAVDRAADIGFGRFVISATTPFQPQDLAALNTDAPAVVARYFPNYQAIFAARGYEMFPRIGRVYDNSRARHALGWRPKYDFAHVLDQIKAATPIGSALARAVGSKGYHDQVFTDGPFPVA